MMKNPKESQKNQISQNNKSKFKLIMMLKLNLIRLKLLLKMAKTKIKNQKLRIKSDKYYDNKL